MSYLHSKIISISRAKLALYFSVLKLPCTVLNLELAPIEKLVVLALKTITHFNLTTVSSTCSITEKLQPHLSTLADLNLYSIMR